MLKIKKALLLVGNTQSFYASPEDKSMSLLLGDAGTAMALSYSENASHMNFSLHSDGSGRTFLLFRMEAAGIPSANIRQ